MTEKVILLGDNKSIAGILTSPNETSSAAAFLFFNAGILHRVGPNRLHVKMARALAERGFTSIRFDLSGLGDSVPRRDGLTYHESRFSETAEVMDYLERRHGISRFVLFGLCSGADQAFRVAERDQRVVGAVLVDGYAYRTWKAAVRHYAGRALSGRAWWGLVRGSHPVWAALRQKLSGSNDNAPASEVGFVMDVPARADAEARFHDLVARGVRLFVVFTGTWKARYNYASQFRDMFPTVDIDSVRIEFWPDVDHLFTLLSHQQRLITTLTDWAIASFRHQPNTNDPPLPGAPRKK